MVVTAKEAAGPAETPCATHPRGDVPPRALVAAGATPNPVGHGSVPDSAAVVVLAGAANGQAVSREIAGWSDYPAAIAPALNWSSTSLPRMLPVPASSRRPLPRVARPVCTVSLRPATTFRPRAGHRRAPTSRRVPRSPARVTTQLAVASHCLGQAKFGMISAHAKSREHFFCQSNLNGPAKVGISCDGEYSTWACSPNQSLS